MPAIPNFSVEITNHHWIDNDLNNINDPCSHGIFLLTINGQEILTAEDGIQDWTTNTSVLRLLRTIDDDFIENRDFGIILHCGLLEMISCPISLDWLLRHEGEYIVITDIKKQLTTNENNVIEYKNLIAHIPKDKYKAEILKVANQVKNFYATSRPRNYSDEQERQASIAFWKEFDELVSKHSS